MKRGIVAMILASVHLMAIPWPEVRPSPQSGDSDLSRMAGTWRCVDEVFNGWGNRVHSRVLYLVIEDDRFIDIPDTWSEPDFARARVQKLSLDPGRTPKSFDLAIGKADLSPKENPKTEGIYRLEGDKLTLCTGDSRPGDFSAPAGSRRLLQVYVRVHVRGPAVRHAPNARAELKRLEGLWIPYEKTDDGNPIDLSNFHRDGLKIDKDQFANGYLDESGKWNPDPRDSLRISLDPDRSPKELDLVWSDEKVSRLLLECIYRLDGDRLTICFGDHARPTDFTSREGSGRELVSYRRASKPESDARPAPK